MVVGPHSHNVIKRIHSFMYIQYMQATSCGRKVVQLYNPYVNTPELNDAAVPTHDIVTV